MHFVKPVVLIFSLFVSNVLSTPTSLEARDISPALENLVERNLFGLQKVHLRVEGKTTTIFEGVVFSKGHDVTTASGGTHHCDGTNNNANPTPGNTPTAALDKAAKRDGFTFDGTYNIQFDDFFITRIGPDTQTSTQFWGLLVNYQFTPVGGCQFKTQTNDEILWAFDAFSVQYFLKLDGQHLAHHGTPFVLTVTDGASGAPLAGASVKQVGGSATATTDAQGHATFTLSRGEYTFKAEKPSSIRSNKFYVKVI